MICRFKGIARSSSARWEVSLTLLAWLRIVRLSVEDAHDHRRAHDRQPRPAGRQVEAGWKPHYAQLGLQRSRQDSESPVLPANAWLRPAPTRT
jgi:hypothetical protein